MRFYKVRRDDYEDGWWVMGPGGFGKWFRQKQKAESLVRILNKPVPGIQDAERFHALMAGEGAE